MSIPTTPPAREATIEPTELVWVLVPHAGQGTAPKSPMSSAATLGKVGGKLTTAAPFAPSNEAQLCAGAGGGPPTGGDPYPGGCPYGDAGLWPVGAYWPYPAGGGCA